MCAHHALSNGHLTIMDNPQVPMGLVFHGTEQCIKKWYIVHNQIRWARASWANDRQLFFKPVGSQQCMCTCSSGSTLDVHAKLEFPGSSGGIETFALPCIA